MSKVRVELGTKINLGNFETFSFQVAVEDENLPGENTSQAFERVWNFVDNRLSEKLDEKVNELRGNKS